MLLKRPNKETTTPAETSSTSDYFARTLVPEKPHAYRADTPPDTPASCPTYCSSNTSPQESERRLERSDNAGNPEFLSKKQNQVLAVSEDETKAKEGQRQVAQAGSDYRHISTSGKSFQVNGNVGETELWASRHNSYFDMATGGNSIQLNGNISDPRIFLTAIKGLT